VHITRIETMQVAVPYKAAIRKYRPTEHTDRPILLVKIHTDENIIGWGEGFRSQNIDALIPDLIGKDPLAINLAETEVPLACALYDIAGKALNVPAYRLIGAKYRDQVPVGWWSPHMEPEDTAREAEIGAKLGFTTHKLKARPWDIVRQVELITKAAGPNFSILIDPNFTFESLPATIKIARQIEQYNIFCFEDPFPWMPNLAQYHLLRQKTDIPVAVHLGAAHPNVLNVLKADAADLLNTGGNVAIMQQISAAADAAGLPVWHQLMGLSLGIGAAFAVHVTATVRNATLPSDILPFTREHDLLAGEWMHPVNGHIAVPEGPGLGIEVDERLVERYRVN
jgi:L-alanine-DL-glutamate epimerase-like enolase superfamily enzyme